MTARARGLRFVGWYAAMLLGAVALVLLICAYGATLTAPAASVANGPSAAANSVNSPPGNAFLHVLIALASVVALGWILGVIFRFVGQPPVMGEVFAGILLGPSVLGRVAPSVAAQILPSSLAPSLGVIAQLGVILYMFLVGLELRTDVLRGRGLTLLATSHASIIAPFLTGAILALYLYPRFSTSDVPFASFALFLGVAMSITAFPVLARILVDRGMQNSELGAVALGCAAADDVTAWCLLALVTGFAQGSVHDALRVAMLTFAFAGMMFVVVRPALSRGLAHLPPGRPGHGVIVLALFGLLLSALTTEWIGIHAIFGAFVAGMVMPRESILVRILIERMRDPVTILLLPAFFAFTGMRTEIGLVSDRAAWVALGLVLIVATAGKFGGTLIAARASGMEWDQAASLGILMNTRGLMELVVLNIGLDLHVVSPTLFTIMVLMALATTTAAAPALELVRCRGPRVRRASM